jgi:predicted glycosyltransferase
MTPSVAPRIAIFTHDSYGLGHVRRCLHIARALAERRPDAAILFITGCPALHVFGKLPQNADYLKIPTSVKTGPAETRPPHLPIGQAEVAALRQGLIRESLVTFRPDVLLVDNFPLGSRRELLPTLKALNDLGTRCVLGLRDILDSPEVVRATWSRQNAYAVLDELYDRIVVYGMREIMDISEAYDLPAKVAEKVRYCGYVTSASPSAVRPASDVRAELGIKGRLVVAAAGGGGDGLPILRTFLQAVSSLKNVSSLVVTGPLMNARDRRELEGLAAGAGTVILREFLRDLPSYLAAADAVVSMCGYNTSAEILALRTKALVIPRTWEYGEHRNRDNSKVEWEQILRGRALAARQLVDLLEMDDLNPVTLAERIEALLERSGETQRDNVDLGGVAAVTETILDLVGEKGQQVHAA